MSRHDDQDSDDELSVNLMTAEEIRDSKLAQKKSEAATALSRREASLSSASSSPHSSASSSPHSPERDDFVSLHELPSNSNYSMTCNWCLLQRVVVGLAIIGCIITVIVLLVSEQAKENAAAESYTPVSTDVPAAPWNETQPALSTPS